MTEVQKITENHQTANLSSRAMLVRLEITGWRGNRLDRQVTAEVETTKGASHDAGRWSTRLVPKSALFDINRAEAEARQTFWKFTLPWDDAGSRILPSTVYFEFSEAIRKCQVVFETAVAEFVAAYPGLMAEAEVRLGDLYRAKDFPAPEQVARKFGWHVSSMPMPDHADFRVDLGAGETARVRQAMEADIAATLARSTRDLWDRLHLAVSRMAEKLADPKGIFRDSLVGNVQEVAAMLTKLNLTGDPELERMRAEVEGKLAGRRPAELRDNKRERAETAAAAQAIVAKMAAFMGGKDTTNGNGN